MLEKRTALVVLFFLSLINMNFHLNDKQKIFLITGIPTFLVWFVNASRFMGYFKSIKEFLLYSSIKPLPYYDMFYPIKYMATIFDTLIFMTWVGSLIGFFLFKDYGKKNVK